MSRLKNHKLREVARRAVSKAVAKGELKPAKNLYCFDCGCRAVCYDHRNYFKPLAVDAVCKQCDSRRGPGYPYGSDVYEKMASAHAYACEQRKYAIHNIWATTGSKDVICAVFSINIKQLDSLLATPLRSEHHRFPRRLIREAK